MRSSEATALIRRIHGDIYDGFLKHLFTGEDVMHI